MCSALFVSVVVRSLSLRLLVRGLSSMSFLVTSYRQLLLVIRIVIDRDIEII